jgi:hypothetical protein
MSQKPSLKKAKLAVQKSVLVLSKEEYSQLHESVIIPFEQAIDNVRNNDELFYDISENLIGIFGYKPSYAMFQLCREETKKALMESKKITENTFKNHYWKYVRDFLDINKEFTFPKSNSVDAIKKQEQREKALSLTKNDGTLHSLIEISDNDLSAGLFGLKGKKVLLDREYANQKALDKLQETNIKKFRDDFVPKMKELAMKEYEFALWIDTNLNQLREDFNTYKLEHNDFLNS